MNKARSGFSLENLVKGQVHWSDPLDGLKN